MKTIKLLVIINAYGLNEKGKPIIVHVFDSIKEFKRKVALLAHFKNLDAIYKLFLKDRQEKIKQLLDNYLEEKNKIIREDNKLKKENKKELTTKDFPTLPSSLMLEFNTSIDKLIETEVEYKPFKFSQKEIEDSGISISQMVMIEDFM